MPLAHGLHTGEFGAWLSEQLVARANLQHYQLYYDHGSATSPHVAAVKGFYGGTVSNQTRLADIDVLVATAEGEAVLLLEIEERVSSPKKILGDVLALLMCNRIAIKQGHQQKYFTISPGTHLLIAGVVQTKGKKVAQLERTIVPRLRQFGGPPDAIPTSNVSFLFHEDVSTTIEALKSRVISVLEQ